MQYGAVTWHNHELNGLDEEFEKDQITVRCCFL